MGDHMLWEIPGRTLPIHVTVREDSPPEFREEDMFEMGTPESWDANDKRRGRGKYAR